MHIDLQPDIILMKHAERLYIPNISSGTPPSCCLAHYLKTSFLSQIDLLLLMCLDPPQPTDVSQKQFFNQNSYLYINLRRSRDCLWVSVRSGVDSLEVCVTSQLRAASFIYFGEVLRCPHKRIVTITKVYIARNNIHMEIIRFRKN